MNPYIIKDKLVIAKVGKLLKSLTSVISANKSLDIDLSLVDEIDSSGIAFLVQLKELANAKSFRLTFINPSAKIIKLCQLYQIKL